MFCPNCGSELKANAKFCPSCGAQLQQPQQTQQPQYAQPVAPPPGSTAFSGNGKVRQGLPAPGYSDRVNDPEVLASVKKNRKSAGIFGLILVPLPLIGFLIYGAVSDDMEIGQAAVIGAIVSAIFLIVALISRFRQRASASYEGVVTDKKSRLRSDSEENDRHDYMEYITYVRTSDGKKKKIVEREGSMIIAFDYLDVGDHFRYHPQFAFPYELYDKRKAPYIGCISCGTHNAVENDRCTRCNTPLLK